MKIVQSTLDISNSKFAQKYWYLKVNFLVPENLLWNVSGFDNKSWNVNKNRKLVYNIFWDISDCDCIYWDIMTGNLLFSIMSPRLWCRHITFPEVFCLSIYLSVHYFVCLLVKNGVSSITLINGCRCFHETWYKCRASLDNMQRASTNNSSWGFNGIMPHCLF